MYILAYIAIATFSLTLIGLLVKIAFMIGGMKSTVEHVQESVVEIKDNHLHDVKDGLENLRLAFIEHLQYPHKH